MATSFKTYGAEDAVETQEQEEHPEGSSQDLPREEHDDCKLSYHGESHKFTERSASRDEQVPSAGWREVYFSMGVSQR